MINVIGGIQRVIIGSYRSRKGDGVMSSCKIGFIKAMTMTNIVKEGFI